MHEMLTSIISKATTGEYDTYVGVGVVVVLLVVYLRNKSISDIRKDLYEVFLKLEHSITGTKVGQERLDEAVTAAYEMLPKWVRLFVSKDRLRKTVDKWFKEIKDLLDDGKLNNVEEDTVVASEVQFEEDFPDDSGDM